jgi:hypothetical protein
MFKRDEAKVYPASSRLCFSIILFKWLGVPPFTKERFLFALQFKNGAVPSHFYDL